MPHHWTLLIEWQHARMMKVTPDPSAFKTKVNCDQESHLRSPLSAVSDSFGHENEVDISKSSEEKTAATGSNVAPRRKGSLFSPMEKNNNNKKGTEKEVHPCYIGEGNYQHGREKKEPFVQITWE